MKYSLGYLRKNIYLRKLILITIDLFTIFFCNLIGISIFANKTSNFYQIDNYIVYIFIAITIYIFFGQYKGLTKYTGNGEIYNIAIRNLLIIILCAFVFNKILNLDVYFGFWIMQWYLLTCNMALCRFLLRDILINSKQYLNSQGKVTNVVIYGAGKAGAQLAASINLNSNQNIVTFIDDNSQLWSRTINGIPINSPEFLTNTRKNIDQVLLAIPSLNNKQFKNIYKKIQDQNFTCLKVPSLEEISSGKAKISSLRKISISDLLKRDIVPPNKELMYPIIRNKSICVIGGGGSIGSELCHQIINLDPKRIVILDSNEFNLYKINNDLISKTPENASIDIFPILGNALNKKLIRKLFIKYEIDLIFHAAAYKHVPIVEKNPIEGIRNNILSTHFICSISKEIESVKNLVFISSDKAVRPTNIMGASKRFSELIVNSYDQIDNSTNFSIVRFGNVLGSSGSVVPLFKKQILSGGPITLTHEKITRYFMTVSEASQLVIFASALSKGGDIFLLDMGEPVAILDLAKQMIKLSGLRLRDKDNLDGDIEIVIKGLRKGEKLYEELLVEPSSIPTKHPLIFKANEKKADKDFVFKYLEKMEIAIEDDNLKSVISILKIVVPEWTKSESFSSI